jgi:hypothetical protein
MSFKRERNEALQQLEEARRERDEALTLYRTAAGQVMEAKALIQSLLPAAERESPAFVASLRKQHPELLEG